MTALLNTSKGGSHGAALNEGLCPGDKIFNSAVCDFVNASCE